MSWRSSVSGPSGWTMAAPVRPCLREFRAEMALPAGVRGPEDFWAFCLVGVDLGFGGHGFWLSELGCGS